MITMETPIVYMMAKPLPRALKAEAGGGGAKTGWYALRSPEVDHGESQN